MTPTEESGTLADDVDASGRANPAPSDTTRRRTVGVTVRATVESDSDEGIEGAEGDNAVRRGTAEVAGRAAGVLGRTIALTPEQRELGRQREFSLSFFGDANDVLAMLEGLCRPGTPREALLANDGFHRALQSCVIRLHNMNVRDEEPDETIARSLRYTIKDLLRSMQAAGALEGSADEDSAERFYLSLCERFIQSPKMRGIMTAELPNEWAHLPAHWEKLTAENASLGALAEIALEKYAPPGTTMEGLLREPTLNTYFVIKALCDYYSETYSFYGDTQRRMQGAEYGVESALEKAGALDAGWRQRPTARETIADTLRQRRK